jgi:multiple sugar transport system permease protein
MKIASILQGRPAERSTAGLADKSSQQMQLLLPVFLLILVFSVLPLLRGMYLGFTDYRLGDPIHFNGLANYSQMLGDDFFWRSFRVGIVWTVLVTTGQMVLGMGLALLMHRKTPYTSLYKVLILAPWAMPPIIRAVVWRQIYDVESGAFNAVLLSMGILDKPINWLTSFEFAIPAVILVGLWGEIPKAALFIYAGLLSIPEELYEAGDLDGANTWQNFRHITLPMLKPVLAATVSLSFIWNFNMFGMVWVLTQGGPAGLTRLPMLAAYEEAFRYGYVGYAAAIGNVMVLLIMAAMFFYLRVQMRDQAGEGRV